MTADRPALHVITEHGVTAVPALAAAGYFTGADVPHDPVDHEPEPEEGYPGEGLDRLRRQLRDELHQARNRRDGLDGEL